MLTSPIQPIEIYFEEISVSMDQAENHEEQGIVPSDFFQWHGVKFYAKHAHEVVQEENRSMVNLRFQFEIPNTEGVKLAYKIKIVAVGRFGTLNVSSFISKGEAEVLDLVVVNGTSILYSTVREKLLEITSRMKPGALSLPSFNFMDIRPSMRKDEVDNNVKKTINRKKRSSSKTITDKK